MISFRYHLVSLISVFLAVALGIIIGTTALNGQVLDGLNRQVVSLNDDKRGLQARTSDLESQLNQGDVFGQAVGPTLVAGRLTDASVVLVLASQDIDADIVAETTALIEAAGATVNGTLQLQPSFSDPQSAQDLQTYVTGSEGLPPGIQLPESDDAAVLVGSLLGTVLMRPVLGDPVEQTATTTVLSGLSTLDALTVESAEVVAADYAVILTQGALSGPDAEARNAALGALAAGLDGAGRGVVVAGDTAAAADTGLLGAVRADATLSGSISTIDNVNVAAGQVSVVLALVGQGEGSAGAYGTADGTELLPPLGP